MLSEQISIQTQSVREWTVRIRQSDDKVSNSVILLLHGWTGDEKSMGIFFPKFPPRSLLLAPRGLYPTGVGGYSWQQDRARKIPHYSEMDLSVTALLELLSIPLVRQSNAVDFGVVGFSQGAALAYTVAFMHPESVNKIAGLSGFLPTGIENLASSRPLLGKKAFCAHGIQDEIVPLHMAHAAVQLLKSAGAEVTYCETPGGHKLGAVCSRGLQKFFEE